MGKKYFLGFISRKPLVLLHYVPLALLSTVVIWLSGKANLIYTYSLWKYGIITLFNFVVFLLGDQLFDRLFLKRG